MGTCRHCTKGRVNRPAGLCWSCYYTPGVREMYGLPAPRQMTAEQLADAIMAGQPPTEPVELTAQPTPEAP